MSAVSERLSQLTPAQRALLAKRLGRTDPRSDHIARAVHPEGAPLSYPQERLWFVEQMLPDAALHNIVGMCRHLGSFDTERFYAALGLVLERHEALRTAIVTDDHGKPRQLVRPAAMPERLVFDLSSLDEPQRIPEADRIVERESHRPFPLAGGILLRAVVIQLAQGDHRVLFVMHHIASDGWSTSVLIREMLAAYDALGTGKRPSWPSLPIAYADFAAWQRRRAAEPSFEQRIQYWVERLTPLPLTLEMPADKPRPVKPSHRGARIAFELEPEIVQGMRALAARAQSTPFMAYLAAYAVLLHRWSGQDTFAVGVPVSGRENSATQGLIGCFLNLLPVPIDFSSDPAFAAFVAQLRPKILADFEHSDVPFETIVSRVCPERDHRLSPLFQATFSFERDPAETLPSSTSGAMRFEEVPTGGARYDLSLELTYGQEAVKGWFDFSSDRFDRDAIERLARCFTALLRQIVRTPEQTVSRLELLAPADRHRLLVDWNRTETPYEADACVHTLFFAQADRTPEAIALVQGDTQVSYRDLQRRVARIATDLAQAGVNAGDIVTLAIDRSVDAVAGMLGILAAGAAYLPIDFAQPAERLAGMIHEAGARVALVDAAGRELLRCIEDIACLAINDAATGDLVAMPTRLVSAESRAYVMYTSGSTGRPKGVAVSHRNIVRLVRHTSYAEFGSAHTGLLLAPLAFDASTFEIWGPLLNGGRLAIAPRGLLGFDQIGDLIDEHRVTTLWLTAGLFQGMVEENLAGLSNLRQLLVGGDVLPRVQVEKFLRAHPQCRLINGYGPTEATTFSCCHTIELTDLQRTSIPIGRPIANTTAYVVDRHLQPVPIGVYGELYIGGDGVGSGYINRPELTAQRFVPNPFASGLLYRTGDRVRFLADGILEFQGRLDQQVKLRGFRIELGDIEAAIATHPHVKETAVAVWATGGTKALAAYIVAAGPALSAGEWRAYLQTKLPDYMVPASFVYLPALPLSPNGKIDRRQLPPPQTSADDGAIADVPATEMQAKLVDIWQELLEKRPIRVSDNFFEIGGDSIRVVQLVSRAARLGIHFNAQDVFSHQTILALSAVAKLERAEDTSVDAPLPTGRIPLTPIQQWFFAQTHRNAAHWNQWVLFRFPEPIPSDILRAGFNLVVARHDAFRLRFRSTGETWAQELGPAPLAAFEILELSELEPERRRARFLDVANRCARTLDLEQGPLIRAVHTRHLTAGSDHIYVTAHHLVVDQVSWYLFFDELQVACDAIGSGREPEFARKTTPFSTWAAWAAEKRPTVRPPAAAAPTAASLLRPDTPGGSNLEGDSRIFRWTGDPSLSEKLHDARNSARCRIDELLVLALGLAAADLVDRAEIEVDIESAGRWNDSSYDVSRTIGWFTHIYPTRLGCKAGELGEFVRTGKARLRAASSQEQYTSHSAAPLAFNFLGEADSTLEHAVEFGLGGDYEIVSRDPLSERTHAILIDGWIAGGSLKLTWNYSAGLFRQETIERLATRFGAALDSLVDFAIRSPNECLVASDFAVPSLAPEQLQTLLAQLVPAAEASPIVEDVYPLTALQKGLLFHALQSPHSDDYLVQLTCRLDGPLNSIALQSAWHTVIDRHAALRAGFYERGLEEPMQVVQPVSTLEWELVDLTAMPEPEKQARLATILTNDRQRTFDLGRPPLMRFKLLQRDAGSATLVWTHHHILLDGWSLAIVLKEVFTEYDAILAGRTSRLGKLTSFRDVCVSRRTADLSKSLSVWRDYLAGFSHPTPLPFAASPGAECAGKLDLSFDAALGAKLGEVARSRRTTLATIFQGAWALTLASAAGVDDVVFGSTVSGRNGHAHVEDIVGLCINTVPQRIRIRPELSAADWLAAIQATETKMRAHDHCGLVEIQGVSAVRRGAPLFATALVVENYPIQDAPARQGDTLHVSDFDTAERVGIPMTLMVLAGEHLRIRLMFQPAIVAAATAERYLATFRRAVEELTRAFDAPLANALSATAAVAGTRPPTVAGTSAAAGAASSPANASAAALEPQLAEMWTELLGVPCGPTDNFYDLGGHSLLLMRLRARLLEQLGRDVPIADLIQRPTVRALAEYLSAGDGVGRLTEAARRRAEARRQQLRGKPAEKRTQANPAP